MPSQVLYILHQCSVAAWPDDAAARCRMHRSVGAEGSMARSMKSEVWRSRAKRRTYWRRWLRGRIQARGGTDRAGHGVAVALHRSTMWREGAVEEADYDDNIREHIVDGAFLSAAGLPRDAGRGSGPRHRRRSINPDRSIVPFCSLPPTVGAQLCQPKPAIGYWPGSRRGRRRSTSPPLEPG